MNIIIIIFFSSIICQKTFWIAKSLQCVSEFFFIAHKDIIIFLSYDTKNFRIAQKFPDSNATLLPGFFSLWLGAAAAPQEADLLDIGGSANECHLVLAICSLCPSSRGCRSAASHTGGSSSAMAAPPSWPVSYLLLTSVTSSLSFSSHYCWHWDWLENVFKTKIIKILKNFLKV